MQKEYNNLIDAVMAVKKNKNVRAIIFDMDGLIFDTERSFMEQLAIVMKEHGYELTRDIYTKTLGLGGDKLVNYMYNIYGYDYPFEECSSQAQARLAMLAETIGLTIKYQIPELLATLKDEGVPCAVASSTKSEFVKKYLHHAGLSEYFGVIIGGEMVPYSKPEPDIFLLACEKLGIAPGKGMVLEDCENGIIAAHSAGIPVICIPDLKEPSKEALNMVNAVVRR